MFTLFSTTFMIFVSFRSFFLNDGDNLAYCLLNFCWIAFYLSFLIVSIYMASGVTKEVRFQDFSQDVVNFVVIYFHGLFQGEDKTTKIVYEIINKSSNKALLSKVNINLNILRFDNLKVLQQLSVFSQQIKHRTCVISCGLFTVDWTLAFSVYFKFPLENST